MDRRRFVSRAVPAALAGATAIGCSREETGPAVQTRPNVVWRLASSFPRTVDSIYGACDAVAARVSAMTDGRFQIRAYPGGEIVPALQVLDAVQQGTVQMGQSCGYYFTGKNPVFAFDTCVPFGFTARQQTAWLLEGGGRELLAPAFADFNVVSIPGGNTGVQMGGWFKRPIGSAADLAGLKIRIPGLGGQVMSRLGATVQVLAGGDIYPALERGAIDATEWVGPYDDEKLGFFRVAKHYYYPGWWEPGATLSYYVNRDALQALPSSYREALEAAALEAGASMQAAYDARNPPALERLISEGVTLAQYPDDVMDAARAATTELLEEQAAASTEYRELYDQWKAFGSSSSRWFATAELAYAGYAFRPGRR